MEKKYINQLYYEEMKFLPGFETFCYQNCLRIIMETQGLDYPALYINAALSLVYDLNNNTVGTTNHIRTLLPSYNKYVNRLYYDDKASTPEQIFQININYILDNRCPIIVGVDTYYLNYATNYMRNHARHTLILCGFDLDQGVVYVVDWYPNWFYKGTVLIEDFLKARSSENQYDGTAYSGSGIKNNWAYVNTIPQESKQKLMTELLVINIRDYYLLSEKDGVLFGIAALEKLSLDLDYIISEGTIPDLYKKLVVISIRNKLFQQYLECFCSITDSEQLRKCITISKKIGVDWDVVLMLVLKCSRKLSESAKQKLLNKFVVLVDDEKERMEDIIQFHNIL